MGVKTEQDAIAFCKYVYSQMSAVTKYEGYTFESYMNSVFLTNEGYEDYFIKIFDETSDKGVGLYRYSEFEGVRDE